MPCKVLGSAVAAHFEALAAIYILLETLVGTLVSAGVVEVEIFFDWPAFKNWSNLIERSFVFYHSKGLSYGQNALD